MSISEFWVSLLETDYFFHSAIEQDYFFSAKIRARKFFFEKIPRPPPPPEYQMDRALYITSINFHPLFRWIDTPEFIT